ncbi:twin-arginine translocase subunit TatC [Rubrivirga marina]|uniref:Sec-independent protein translocase protein TatC n=1 Tax=Rubrivirga marina TaxID=1196024 RepID=A0A271IYF3_9BACT|nr:twin-arginine translocase subunit TatC [Rubrivirga marina]PAP75549.1 twin arginine-targeting protein translocase TatC [Rubrivirga marina]
MRPAPGEMPFLDHLEELRWRILKSLGAILLCVGLCLFFTEWIMDGLLLGPTRASFFMYDVLRLDAIDVVLQNRTVTGQFFAFFGTVIAAGVVIGSPVVVYQTWKFIEPGLYPDERQGLRFAAVFATFFFALGISFGYLIIAPVALQFFAQFQISDSIVNEFDISKYFSMLITWAFGAGIVFELPVVVTILAKVGVLTQAMLKASRRYAIVIVLVISAFITPPDPWSQFLMAIPLMGLFELSIGLTGIVERRRARDLAAEERREAKEREKREAEAARATTEAASVEPSAAPGPEPERPESE